MFSSACWALAGMRASSITRLRRMSTMVGTCSISTGQASMHAPQVVQAHSSSSVIALGSIGSASSSDTCARARPMPAGWRSSSSFTSCMIFFGESDLPVMFAGHTASQRPHSVQV